RVVVRQRRDRGRRASGARTQARRRQTIHDGHGTQPATSSGGPDGVAHPPGRSMRSMSRQPRDPPPRPGGSLRPSDGWPRWIVWVLIGLLAAVLVLPALFAPARRDRIDY